MAAQKAKMGVDDEDDQEDDGFMEALKGSAEEDWKDGGIYEPEDEETNI